MQSKQNPVLHTLQDFFLLIAISTHLSSRLLLRFLLVSTAQRLSGHTPLGKSGDVLDTAHGVG